MHDIQQVAVEDMKTREHAIFGQLKTSKKTISSLKHTVKETKNKEKKWQDDRQCLDIAVTLTCCSFDEEGITPKMFFEAKFFILGEIDDNFYNRVMELESKMIPITPM